MPRYIDADNIEKDLVRYADSIDKTQTFSGVLRLIVRDTPAADVVPVVHGKWIRNIHDKYFCSICGTRFSEWNTNILHYCPDCGAKMDGENEGRLSNESQI